MDRFQLPDRVLIFAPADESRNEEIGAQTLDQGEDEEAGGDQTVHQGHQGEPAEGSEGTRSCKICLTVKPHAHQIRHHCLYLEFNVRLDFGGSTDAKLSFHCRGNVGSAPPSQETGMTARCICISFDTFSQWGAAHTRVACFPLTCSDPPLRPSDRCDWCETLTLSNILLTFLSSFRILILFVTLSFYFERSLSDDIHSLWKYTRS